MIQQCYGGVMVAEGRKRTWLQVIVALFLVAVLVFFALFGAAAYQSCVFESNLQKLQVGDSKDRVLELLGEPRARFAKGGQLVDALRKESPLLWFLASESPETWVYGPWRLVKLGRTNRDYAIEFDNNGRISRIQLPSASEN